MLVQDSYGFAGNFYADSSDISTKIWHRNMKDRNFFQKQEEDAQTLFQTILTDMQPIQQSNNVKIMTWSGYTFNVIDQEQSFLTNYLPEIIPSLTLILPTSNPNAPIKLLGNAINFTEGVSIFYFGNLELAVSTFANIVKTIVVSEHLNPNLVFNFLDANKLEQDPLSENYCMYFIPPLSPEVQAQLSEANISPVGLVMKSAANIPTPVFSSTTNIYITKEGFSFTARTKDGKQVQPIRILNHNAASSFYYLTLDLYYNTHYYNFNATAYENNNMETSSNGEIYFSHLSASALNDLSLFCNTDRLYDLLAQNLIDDSEGIDIFIEDEENPYNISDTYERLIVWRNVENQYVLNEGFLSVSYDFEFEAEENNNDPGGGDEPDPGGGDEPGEGGEDIPTPTLVGTEVLLYSDGIALQTFEEECLYGDNGETLATAYGIIGESELCGDYVYLTSLNPADYVNNIAFLFDYIISYSVPDSSGNFIFGCDITNISGDASPEDLQEEANFMPPLISYAFTIVSESDYINANLSSQQALNILGKKYTVGSCLSPDTLITMADFSQRQIRDLTIHDIILNKNLNPQKIIKIDMNNPSNFSDYYYFDDGTIIHTTNPHRFFNIEQGFYQYLHEWKIGEHARKIDGTTPALIRKETIQEDSICCGIWTEDRTCWANGLLSSETAANEELLQTMDLNSAKNMFKTILKEKIRGILQ